MRILTSSNHEFYMTIDAAIGFEIDKKQTIVSWNT